MIGIRGLLRVQPNTKRHAVNEGKNLNENSSGSKNIAPKLVTPNSIWLHMEYFVTVMKNGRTFPGRPKLVVG